MCWKKQKKKLHRWGELQSQVINLCVFVTTSNTLHIKHPNWSTVHLKILITAALKYKIENMNPHKLSKSGILLQQGWVHVKSNMAHNVFLAHSVITGYIWCYMEDETIYKVMRDEIHSLVLCKSSAKDNMELRKTESIKSSQQNSQSLSVHMGTLKKCDPIL